MERRQKIINCKLRVSVLSLIFNFMIFTDIRLSTSLHIPSNFSEPIRLKRQSQCDSNFSDVGRPHINDLSSFRCYDGTCISKYDLCDGVKNCPDGSDETFSACYSNRCPSSTFQCAYGACVKMSDKCNGRSDCADNSDELLKECPNFQWLNSGVTSKCGRGKFQCRNGICIEETDVCDGKADCRDGSDESITQCSLMDCSGFFQCAYGACIRLNFKCNGLPECADASDEDRYLCGYSAPATSPKPSVPAPVEPPTTSSSVNSCEEVPQITGGRYVRLSEDLFSLECDEEYVLKYHQEIRGKTVRCVNGKFQQVQSCVRGCKIPNHISITLTCTDQRGTSECPAYVRPKTKYTAKCAYGYEHGGKKEINECNEGGSWKIKPGFQCKEDCGIDPNQSGQVALISGGTKANASVPWNTGLYSLTDGGSWDHICGGNLITAHIVLTAAHCITAERSTVYREVSKLKITVGKFYADFTTVEVGQATHEVAQLYKPDRYETVQYSFDIGIVRLKDPVIFNEKALPVCIPHDFTLRAHLQGTVFGWGRDENDKGRNELYSVKLPYVPREECLKHITRQSEIPDDKFCAFLTNGTGVQRGDSGAGYTLLTQNRRYSLFGIVSTRLCQTCVVTTFTNIGYQENLLFITKTIYGL